MKQIYTFILIALIQDDILIEDPDKIRMCSEMHLYKKRNLSIKNVNVVILHFLVAVSQ